MKKNICLFLILFVFSVFTLGCDEVVVPPETFDGPTVDKCDNGAAGSITFRIGDGNPRILCADEPGKFGKMPAPFEGSLVYNLYWKNPLNENESMKLIAITKSELTENQSDNFSFAVQYLHESAPGTIFSNPGYSGVSTDQMITEYGGDGKVLRGTFSGKLKYAKSKTEINIIEVSGNFDIVINDVGEISETDLDPIH